MYKFKILMWVFILTIGTFAMAQTPVGIDFTYQGELKLNNQLPTGAYDFEISAYDAITDGNIYDVPLDLIAINVVKGIFVLPLTFGDITFTGNEVYLQIKVRETGSGVSFDLLSPRQKVTSAPYAIHTQFVAADSVTQAQIQDQSINTQDLADNSITSSKIAVDAVQENHFQNIAISASKFAADSVGELATNSQIQKRINGTCANAQHIKAINSDGSLDCRADAVISTVVTTIEIVDATISSVDMATGLITADKISNNSITAPAMATNAIASLNIINNSISSSDIDSADIQLRIDHTCSNTRFISAVFEDGSVNCALENNGTVTVTSQEIVDGTIASIDLSANAIENNQLSNNAVTANKIANNTVDASNVDNSEVQLRINSICDEGTFTTGFNQDGSIICLALPISLDFVVDSAGTVGEYTSMVINPSTGFAIISYYEPGFGDLKIFFCSNAICSSGVSRLLDTSFEVGQYNSIALAAGTQYPIISYYDNTNKDLKLYVCNDAECLSGTIKVLDSTDDVGQYTSIIINSVGFPLISYYDNTNKALKIYNCADATCDFVTNGFTVDNSAQVGRYNSMVLRPASGFPMISYKDDTNGSLKVYDCTNSTCALGTARNLDASASVGSFTSIAINNLGNPTISYFDFTNKDLKLFSCTNASCTVGLDVTLDSLGAVGEYTSIAIDPTTNYPIVSYYDASNTALKMYFCSHENCVTGESKFVDNLGDVGQYSSITIGSDGFAIISYFDSGNDDLKVLHCSNTLCN